MKKQITFIVNPFSGTSRKGNIEQLVYKYLDHSTYDYNIEYTKAPGHAVALAAEAVAKQVAIVVAVGGDGSVNEVAQSLLHSNTALGVLPGGSGNGFAMHLGLGRNIVNAIKVLNTGTAIKIDTCTVNDRFFVNVAGIGFDARIAYKTKENAKRGFIPYLKTTLQQAKHYRPLSLKIDVDGDVFEGKYALAAIANATMFGYYFTIAPKAKFDDGLLDLMLVKDASIIKYAASSYRFLNSSLHKSSVTDLYQGKRIQITILEDDYFHVDGEGMIAEKHLDFKIVPKSLSVICPSDSSLR